MNISMTFIRVLFICVSLLVSIVFVDSIADSAPSFAMMALGVICGGAFAFLLIGVEMVMRRMNLRSFNLATVGIFFGYLLGQGILMVLMGVVSPLAMATNPDVETLVKATVFLTTIYLGMALAMRAEEEFYVSLPFVKLKPTAMKKKDILVDESLLSDARIIDLASSGLLDNHLVVPRFIMDDLCAQNEKGDENTRNKARRSLEVIKKLENMHSLEMRYTDMDFADVKDPLEKMVKLARMLDANILTADTNQVQQTAFDGVRVIKFQQLCNALKPLTQSGEYITIKIQRYGKEARQGVGYLDDGTMVVVNGGAEYIGEAIKAQVLSVKHTSSGRMIFCNALEETFDDDDSYDMSQPNGNLAEGVMTKGY